MSDYYFGKNGSFLMDGIGWGNFWLCWYFNIKCLKSCGVNLWFGFWEVGESCFRL